MKFTQKSFVENSQHPKLARAVVAQFGGWEVFTQAARDLQNGGIDGGFHGFVYHSETEPFARRNRREIAELAESQAVDIGIEITRMIQGFGCFKGCDVTGSEIGRALYAGENTPDGYNVLNALAWYAGEEIAREYINALGNEHVTA